MAPVSSLFSRVVLRLSLRFVEAFLDVGQEDFETLSPWIQFHAACYFDSVVSYFCLSLNVLLRSPSF